MSHNNKSDLQRLLEEDKNKYLAELDAIKLELVDKFINAIVLTEESFFLDFVFYPEIQTISFDRCITYPYIEDFSPPKSHFAEEFLEHLKQLPKEETEIHKATAGSESTKSFYKWIIECWDLAKFKSDDVPAFLSFPDEKAPLSLIKPERLSEEQQESQMMLFYGEKLIKSLDISGWVEINWSPSHSRGIIEAKWKDRGLNLKIEIPTFCNDYEPPIIIINETDDMENVVETHKEVLELEKTNAKNLIYHFINKITSMLPEHAKKTALRYEFKKCEVSLVETFGEIINFTENRFMCEITCEDFEVLSFDQSHLILTVPNFSLPLYNSCLTEDVELMYLGWFAECWEMAQSNLFPFPGILICDQSFESTSPTSIGSFSSSEESMDTRTMFYGPRLKVRLEAKGWQEISFATDSDKTIIQAMISEEFKIQMEIIITGNDPEETTVKFTGPVSFFIESIAESLELNDTLSHDLLDSFTTKLIDRYDRFRMRLFEKWLLEPSLIKLREEIVNKYVMSLPIKELSLAEISTLIEEAQLPDLNDHLKVFFTNILKKQLTPLGPLEELLANADIHEIYLNSPGQIHYEYWGRVKSMFGYSTALLTHYLDVLINKYGIFIRNNDLIDIYKLKLDTAENVYMPVLSVMKYKGKLMTAKIIKKKTFRKITSDKLVEHGSLSSDVNEFLTLAYQTSQNILFTGNQGSGRQTLLKSFLWSLPTTWRIVHVGHLPLEGFEHYIFIDDFPSDPKDQRIKLAESLSSYRGDYTIFEDIHGAEAWPLILNAAEALFGLLASMHADSPEDALERLRALSLMHTPELTDFTIQTMLARSFKFIVQHNRLEDGSRRIVRISELICREGDGYELKDVFLFQEDEQLADGKITGNYIATGHTPEFIIKAKRQGRKFNYKMFSNE